MYYLACCLDRQFDGFCHRLSLKAKLAKLKVGLTGPQYMWWLLQWRRHTIQAFIVKPLTHFSGWFCLMIDLVLIIVECLGAVGRMARRQLELKCLFIRTIKIEQSWRWLISNIAVLTETVIDRLMWDQWWRHDMDWRHCLCATALIEWYGMLQIIIMIIIYTEFVWWRQTDRTEEAGWRREEEE